MKEAENVLILSPHTDDGELGCGGTIARLVEERKNIFYMAFSICEASVPKEFPCDILEHEVRKATKVLGIKKDNIFIKKYPVRYFDSYRQDILEDIIRLRKDVQPDLIFLPSWNSLHQDHGTISKEGLRAFKKNTCLGYDLPWDQIQFNSNAFYKLEQRHIELKIESLNCYASQKFRSYIDSEFIRGLARVRGAQVDTKYAETFEIIRRVI